MDIDWGKILEYSAIGGIIIFIASMALLVVFIVIINLGEIANFFVTIWKIITLVILGILAFPIVGFIAVKIDNWWKKRQQRKRQSN